MTELPHVCDETQLVSPDIVSTGFPGTRYDRRDLLIARNKRMMGTIESQGRANFVIMGTVTKYMYIVASFPGLHPASCHLQYG